MSELESEQKRPSVEEAEPAAKHQPTTKEPCEIASSVANSKLRDEALYGPAPIQPFESEERYRKISDWLKPHFGGHLSRFEHYLRKEMVDSIFRRRRWDGAEAALTNRLGRQLMETAAPSTLLDFESLLSGLCLPQLLALPAPQELSGDELARLEAPPALRAVALVKSQPMRAALMSKSELEDKRFNAANDLLMELRERRGQIFAMDQFNGLAQNVFPPAPMNLMLRNSPPMIGAKSSSGCVRKTASSMPNRVRDGLKRDLNSSDATAFFAANRLGPWPISTSPSKSILASSGQVMP
jgi:hypothetical protein